MDTQMNRSFYRACTLWLSSLMGTKTISLEDLALLEFVHNVFVELTPGDQIQNFGNLPSVINSEGSDFAMPEEANLMEDVDSDSDTVQVVKSPSIKGLQIFRVSEKLCEQSNRLKRAMFFHILQGRARGSHPLVLQRLATIRRVVNFERLALFQDAEQAELVLEFLFRSLIQVKWGKLAAKERFENLHAYSREVISFYMEAKIKEIYKDDFHLVQIEEMQRHVRTQMVTELQRMQEEARARDELMAEWAAKNERLCSYFEHVVGHNTEQEARLLRWDLNLAMSALLACYPS